MWRRSTTTDRYDSCEAIIDVIAKEYHFDIIENVVDDLEKFDLGFEIEEETRRTSTLKIYAQNELGSSLDIIKNNS